MGMSSSKRVSPSEQIDHVWHIHLAHNDHYNSAIESLFGIDEKFDHVPSLGGNN